MKKIMLREKTRRYSLALRGDIPYCYCVNELTLTTQEAKVRKALARFERLPVCHLPASFFFWVTPADNDAPETVHDGAQSAVQS